MLINNIDIANFKAVLLSKDIQTSEILTYDDWLRNSLDPLYVGKKERYKPIKLRLYIEDVNDETVLNHISNLVKQFEKCTLKFEDLSFYYDATIVNTSHEEIVTGAFILEVELKSGYAYKIEVVETANRVSNKTINVGGNSNTPAIVEITPSANLIDLVVTGLGEPFTINNLTAEQKIIINSEDGTVTQNGDNKFLDYDGWEFPRLVPGANLITFSQVNCDINIKYKPRWI